MRRSIIITLLALGGGLSSCAAVDGPRTQISSGFEIGGDFGDSTGNINHLEGEFVINEKLTISARVLTYSYDYDDTDGGFGEKEDGDGLGLGAELRFYPSYSLEGYYLGVGLALFPDAEWTNTNNGVVTSGDESVIAAYGSMGYTFNLGPVVSLTPTLILGNFESDSPNAGFTGGLGLRLGFSF